MPNPLTGLPEILTPGAGVGYEPDPSSPTSADGTPNWESVTSPLAGLDPQSVTAVAMVDADGDGEEDDLVVGTVAGEPSYVYLGDGSGSFEGVEPLPIPDAGHVSQIVATDQDGDGEPDLILAHDDGPAVVLSLIHI